MSNINEVTKSSIYRVLDHISKDGKQVWNKLSFWTKAKDVELSSGITVDEALNDGNIKFSVENGLLTTTIKEGDEWGRQISIGGEDFKRCTAPCSCSPTIKGNVILENLTGDSYQRQLSGKNLLPITNTAQTINGVTFTVDSTNGSITVNGTATADVWFKVGEISSLPMGEYVLSGCPNDGSTSTYVLAMASISDLGNGQSFTLSEDSDTVVSIGIYSGYTANNLIFYPMIHKADITDTTYEPYCGGMASPNPDYPQEIESVGDSGAVEVKTVGKNLLKNTAVTTESNGITFTVNEDGSVTVNGTATANAIMMVSAELLPVGDYIVNGCNSGNYDICILEVRTTVSDNQVYYTNYDSDKAFSITEETTAMSAYIKVSSGFTVNTTVYPMIRLATETDATYEPYTESTLTIPLTEPLRAIGDVKDEICIQDGKYGVLRRIGKYVINSDSNITVTPAIETTIYEGMTRMNVALHEVTNHLETSALLDQPLMSDILTKPDVINTGMGIWCNNSGKGYMEFRIIYYTDVIGSTAEEFRTWLADNPITLNYALATPVFEPFEDQTPFYELMAHDEVTNISIVCGDNLNPSATVMYPSTETGVLTLNNYVSLKKNPTTGSMSSDLVTDITALTTQYNELKTKVAELNNAFDIILEQDDTNEHELPNGWFCKTITMSNHLVQNQWTDIVICPPSEYKNLRIDWGSSYMLNTATNAIIPFNSISGGSVQLVVSTGVIAGYATIATLVPVIKILYKKN